MEHYALLADVVYILTKIFHCVEAILNFISIYFTGAIGKLEATKLVMKQSALFPQFVSEGTQIFHCVK